MLQALQAICSDRGWPLSEAQIQAFEAYEAALYAWNEVKNLTRIPREECEERHFVESVQILDILPEGSSVVDIGTGPGLPAWPIACARPDLQVTAVDSNGKMLDFLRSQPLPNLRVVYGRMEELDFETPFDAATGRAVAPLAIQLELSAACVRVGGRIVPFRTFGEHFTGPGLGRLGLELEDVRWRGARAFPVYRKVSATPPIYPRRWPVIREDPLPIG